ncbi:MAG: tetratricopeptide repeat protein [bacterium]
MKKLDLAIKDLSVACDLKKEDPIAFNSLGLAYFDG